MIRNKTTGVYKITNNITGEFYIGFATDIKSRINWHKNHGAKFRNTTLYKNIRQYGWDNFKWEIIEETTLEDRYVREEYWIKRLVPTLNEKTGHGGFFSKHTESVKKHLSELNSGDKHPQSLKLKDSNGNTYGSLKQYCQETGHCYKRVGRFLRGDAKTYSFDVFKIEEVV